MKIIITVLLAAITCTAYLKFSRNALPVQTKDDIRKLKQVTPACSPELTRLNLADPAKGIPLLGGWGNYAMKVTVSNDSARIYFQQGINMYYGFHVVEALASFIRALQFDSTFAMAQWGKALSYGPNINDNGYSASPDALTAMYKAKALFANCSEVEKQLIEAMQVRYNADSTQSRSVLNQRYSDAMKKVYAQFPENADVATLLADALMVQHPWDLYYKNYKPKSWTPEIVQLIEKTLQKSPDHPGASHYYIHAIEASAHPEKGMAVSNKLPAMMPGVAHLVHMPSHIYIRSGYYSEGETVNDQAVKGYYDYLGKYPDVQYSSFLYLVHNLHMQATCANMDGQYKKSLRLSVDTRNSLDSSWQAIPDYNGMFVQYAYMTPYLTLIRFGKWQEVLQTPENPAANVYAHLLWTYGQGLAHARSHDLPKASISLQNLKQEIKHKMLEAPAPSFANPAINGARVAEKILEGVIAEEQKNYAAAIQNMEQAKVLEDSMIYNEPKDWVHPVRQYLGNVLIKAKKYVEAEKIFREDLEVNPNNGWSLTGLANTLARQGNVKRATQIKKMADKAFSRADEKITAAVF